MNNILSYILGLFLAVVLQVLLFNHLSLFGGVVFVYLIALIKTPLNVNRIAQIVIGFFIGFIIDIFCNTHGMHALTAGTVMLFRDPILHLYIGTQEIKYNEVNVSRLGVQHFMRFAITIVAFFAILLYFIEAFTLFNFFVILTKALLSILLTWAFAMIWELSTVKK